MTAGIHPSPIARSDNGTVDVTVYDRDGAEYIRIAPSHTPGNVADRPLTAEDEVLYRTVVDEFRMKKTLAPLFEQPAPDELV